jgi:AhpD family alkylhydroperoxidase
MTGNSTIPDQKAAPEGFDRRFYSSLKEFWRDLGHMLSNRNQIKSAMRDTRIDPAFRERLMMAVTEVNGCRYCRSFHIGQAREAGISLEEINIYLLGTIPEDIPEDQKLAVCYAQHWAENDQQADKDYQQQVREWYGEDSFQSISMILRMIWMGNLLGNTWDYFLHKISFGRLGR